MLSWCVLSGSWSWCLVSALPGSAAPVAGSLSWPSPGLLWPVPFPCSGSRVFNVALSHGPGVVDKFQGPTGPNPITEHFRQVSPQKLWRHPRLMLWHYLFWLIFLVLMSYRGHLLPLHWYCVAFCPLSVPNGSTHAHVFRLSHHDFSPRTSRSSPASLLLSIGLENAPWCLYVGVGSAFEVKASSSCILSVLRPF